MYLSFYYEIKFSIKHMNGYMDVYVTFLINVIKNTWKEDKVYLVI